MPFAENASQTPPDEAPNRFGSKAKKLPSVNNRYRALKLLEDCGPLGVQAWGAEAEARKILRPRTKGPIPGKMWSCRMGSCLIHLGLVTTRKVMLTYRPHLEYSITPLGQSWIKEYESSMKG